MKTVLLFFVLALPVLIIAQRQINPCIEYPEITDSFSKNRPHWHEYITDTTIICNTKEHPGCTLDLVYNTMLSNKQFILTTKDTTPVRNCEMVIVSLAKAGNIHFSCKCATVVAAIASFTGIPEKLNKEPVITMIDITKNSVIIFTSPGNYMHASKVTHEVLQVGNEIKVVTKGVGNNKNRFRSKLNGSKWLANCIFLTIERKLKKEVEKQLANFESTHLPQIFNTEPFF